MRADFQLGDKPIGALELCPSSVERTDHVTASTKATPMSAASPHALQCYNPAAAATPMSVSLTIKSSKRTKTPGILRRRRGRKLCSSAGKKSVVRSVKSCALTSSVSRSIVVTAADSGVPADATPEKERSEQILPFSPSQVRNPSCVSSQQPLG